MRLRQILFFCILMLTFLPASAVLKEKNLSETLSILRAELQHTHDEMGTLQQELTERSNTLREQLLSTMNRSNQNALMLYSQKSEYIFDLTYACHEATEQYKEFHASVLPFKMDVQESNAEVARYDSLITSLTTMPLFALDDKAKIDRNVCLTLAINIRRMVVENQQTLQEYMRFYQFSEARLKNLNDYAIKRYDEIQNNIFINGGDSYPMILANLSKHLSQTQETVKDKYVVNEHQKISSQWEAKVMYILFIAIGIYAIIAIALNLLVIRIAITRLMKLGKFDSIRDRFLAKRSTIIMTSTVVTFAVILCIVRMVMTQNFVLMASNLLVEFAWLMSVILISILIRVEAEKTIKTVRVYVPVMCMGFLVIFLRIVLTPSEMVNLVFPPILLFCTLWQWWEIKSKKKLIQRSDRFYAYISMTVLLISTISSWIGYTLMAVQLLIWWVMQLTCLLTITCLRDWYRNYALNHNIRQRPVTETWFYYFFTQVVTPALAVASVMLAIYWAADIFNLSGMTWDIFTYHFIDSDDFQLSIFAMAGVVVLWFLFNYINRTSKHLVRQQFEKIDSNSAESRSMMVINVLQVVIWGVWFIITLAYLHVSNTWLVVISGGLSTGIGFASKDILENIYYGISLMAGRIKIGDMIICDETRGRVKSISYTSTMIEAVDGSIIAFQNSQLFTKNYKNLTMNHGLEAQILEVGVAYGSVIKEVREIIINAVKEMECVKAGGHDVTVMVKELGDNSVNLKVIVWLDAFNAVIEASKVLECIYTTLNDNNIEIPFPQRDIHIINP